ncbi:amino acid adenylation domain-containing protein [Streptomyces acidiscabies]|uniref:Amino acid adenylation domain-containing protein n=1 Tax=Streptomyces acidiscabies TaxID=42234 RepID=A0AAP6B975_9ACTN|nr:amino acid adenylation domain-containing protein [Streptomyces acidiscabies]MBZ3916038.1 amino acid adenylation domain-containing protein [Streptomyces acidiscabies]MDX2960429.1 amino acid adenylation domain-containing protein [Streptomyces acidiscabies]MDX3017715.1 amino acid adenylation domain-containing protein [Streptomyces acidiscabies]MDX3794356.1 amino acid adenylation domain-containing protein [Streptomyces acidiscabies]
MVNPIHDDNGVSLVLVNSENRHALWAGGLDVPPGWRVAHRAQSRRECLEYIGAHWPDIRPARSPDDGTGACLPDLFAAQAKRTPGAPALIWQDQQLTYRQLDDESSRLAAFLRQRGIGPGAFVGLCVERSPQMITALLAVLKTGAAYVPLDPEYPAGRLRYVLADTGARLLLTQEPLSPLFPDYDGEIVCLDRHRQDIDALPTAPAPDSPAPLPSDIAYVIHTSGSTGRPKGVLVTHRSLANHSFAVNRHFAFAPGDRVLQCRPLSFDAAAEEIFPPLLHGAALVLGSDPLRQTFRALTQQVIDTGTTFLSVPTAFWHSWVAEEDCLLRLATESSLRTMIVAGEKAARQALLTWKKRVGEDIRWFNVYGPTEGTITTTVHEPGADWEGSEYSSVPIGRPIDNVRTYVLDDALRPVPAGEPGELFIGGAGVAVGYLGAPQTTAERFLPDPFSGVPGSRLYRTGDLVLADADGCLEFLGRRDHQVKLRGYRIELGEIEAVLAEHQAVTACVAQVTGDGPDSTLVCFVAADRRTAPAAAELITHLRGHLPWYMIPTAVHVLDAFPMTPNGKIDRTALLALEPDDDEAAHIAPRTPVEAVLADIWEDILGRPGISVDADFFQVGGHSLLAASLIARIRARFDVGMTARVLFESPTIAGLAEAVTRATGDGRS